MPSKIRLRRNQRTHNSAVTTLRLFPVRSASVQVVG
jgi:hypothetical protein